MHDSTHMQHARTPSHLPPPQFDRDKDLEIKITPKAGAAMLKDASGPTGLASRFSSGGR
jgi:hypothetical protein